MPAITRDALRANERRRPRNPRKSALSTSGPELSALTGVRSPSTVFHFPMFTPSSPKTGQLADSQDRKRAENGVTDGARTHDNRSHSPGLYQLSYSHHKDLTENNAKKLVGVERFELPTSCSQSKRATRLRYTPIIPKFSPI